MCGLDWAWNWQHICPLSPRTCSPQVSNLKWSWLLLEVTLHSPMPGIGNRLRAAPSWKQPVPPGESINGAVVVFQLLCCVRLFATPWTAALQAPLSSTSPRVCSDSCPLSQRCHPITLSSVAPSSSCPRSFPASGSFPVSQVFASGGHRFGASASVVPMDIQGWFTFELTGLLPWQCKGLSRVLTSSTVPGNGIFFSSEKNWAVKLGKTWRNLKWTLLSEGSQSEKATYCLIPTVYGFLEKAKL